MPRRLYYIALAADKVEGQIESDQYEEMERERERKNRLNAAKQRRGGV